MYMLLKSTYSVKRLSMSPNDMLYYNVRVNEMGPDP